MKKSRFSVEQMIAAVKEADAGRTVAFVEDALSTGRKLRTLTIVDAFTRECPHIEVDTSLPSLRVIRALNQLAEERGLPEILRVDNGPEFISKALDAWAFQRESDSTSPDRANRRIRRILRASTVDSGMNA